MKKITTIEELDQVLKDKFGAVDSSIEEINADEESSLEGDNEHDYTLYDRVYKILKKDDEVDYFIIFSKNNKLAEFKYIGYAEKDMIKLWDSVDWEEEER